MRRCRLNRHYDGRADKTAGSLTLKLRRRTGQGGRRLRGGWGVVSHDSWTFRGSSCPFEGHLLHRPIRIVLLVYF